MQSPIPHDLSIYDDQFDFEKHGFCPHQWEVSVPQKNCIVWGVVLSYLRTADFTTPGQFEERLNRLTEDGFDSQTAKTAILDFNPFFNIHKCFFDETLQEVCQSFRKVMNGNRSSEAPKTVAHDIQLIATLLKSNILIVDLSNRNLHLVSPSHACTADLGAITLLCREYTNSNGKKPVALKRFTFSMSKDLCWELRKNAFQIILESTEIRDIAEKEIQTLADKKEKKVNMLITLLKKNLTHGISELYDSLHTVAKLADAGFETDPRVSDDSGFSAFYYALQSSDSNLVSILYRYAANSCYESENTFRNPNPCIFSNFSNLKAILTGDCDRSNDFKNFGDRAELARVTYQDLLRFNEFLTQVTRGINEIRKRPHGSPLKEAAKQREMILLILDTYDNFFHVGQLDSPRELIENYASHKTYHENLDLAVALLFFDNIFLLKSVLKSPEKGFCLKLEFSFLLCAVTIKHFFVEASKGLKVLDLNFNSESNNLSIIPLSQRYNFREKVKKFCRILGDKQPASEDVECIPKHEITDNLSYLQEFKDEFFVNRLDFYLKTALETKAEGQKQKLTVQRALHVLGESINVEGEEPSCIKHFFRKCLPAETLEDLKLIRNTLSHLKSFQFPLKFKTEEDDILFTSIQTEIRRIKESFENVFDFQRVRYMEFLINQGLSSFQKFQQNEGLDVNPLQQPMKNFEDELRKRSSELKYELDRMDTVRNGALVPNIKEFCLKLECLSESAKGKIQDEIPLEVRNRAIANRLLLNDLDRGDTVDVDALDSLFLKENDIRTIKNEYKTIFHDDSEAEASEQYNLLRKIIKAPNPLHTLDLIFDKKKVSDSQLKHLFEWIPFSGEPKTTLNSLIEILNNPCGDNLANLLNRIEHLFQIAIEEQHDIRLLWEKAKSSKAKQHLVHKIVKRFLGEPDFRCSVEMLLFDCVAILKNVPDFECFWKKNSLLFNGIDLRVVLTHDHPLIESIGDILDPKDLPSGLVKKMLQLFEDRECIGILHELLHKERLCDEFPANSSEWRKSKDRIVCCARWQEYCKLFAENPADSEICDAAVSFLKKVTEPKKRTEK